MDLRVAQRACLVFLGLVVECRRCRGASVNRKSMALQAKKICLTHIQQARIGGSVWRVAGNAAFCLDGRVLIDEGTLLFCVAFETNGVLGGSGTKLPLHEPTMRVMAIIALDETLVHAMMKRPVELLFRFKVTAITKLRLLIAQQVFCNFRMMRRMALNAANIVLHVCCTREVVVLRIESVTSQTTFTRIFGAGILEGKYFCWIGAFRMFFARPMACFATLRLQTAFRVMFSRRMRAFYVIVVDVFVTGLACFCTYVVRVLGWRATWSSFGRRGRNGILVLFLRSEHGRQGQNYDCK